MLTWAVQLIDLLFTLLTLAIVARALISWFRVDPYHPPVQFLTQIAEPSRAPLRRVIPPMGMMDISPLVAILLLQAIQQILVALIAGII